MNNLFAPLRDLLMENAETGSEENSTKRPETSDSPGKGRQPPIVLTWEINLISLQRQIRRYRDRNNATGNRITIKSMVDNNAIQTFHTDKNLHFFTFYTKADKPVFLACFCRGHHRGHPRDRLRHHRCETDDRKRRSLIHTS
jgi:hypothetical protein